VTRTLFWDIDGTLLSTARAGVFALEEAAREVCGSDADLQALRTAGLTDSEVAARAIESLGLTAEPQLVSAFLRAYERHLPDRLHWRRGGVLGGVRAILDDLRDDPEITSLLLTGNTPAGARAKLEHYGLCDDFDGGAFCADGDDRETIARRALTVAAEHAGEPVAGKDIVVIGDTPHDVRCGRAIAAATLAVASGSFTVDELRAAGATAAIEQLPDPAGFRELLETVAAAPRGSSTPG
jgi:phosphoglycolate phosphatase